LTQRTDEQSASTALSAESRQTCADCGQEPPATQTNYTLISARHGWRLARSVDENGRKVMKWRCPECWKKYRTSK
jgi:hypothetical protein